jgi:nitrate reductase gamma subunit
MIDVLLFGAFPYVAIVLFFVISIWRYRKNAYRVSSLSSQFLESRKLFWGSVPFHLGILTLFLGHLIGFLIPRQVMAWNESPLRLLVLEVTGLVAGLLTLVGLVLLIWRRHTSDRLRPLTSKIDVLLYLVLLFDVVTGLYIALGHRWGSAWYVHVLAPYLQSLFTFQPNVSLVADLPIVVKMHVVGAFVLFALFSFTRLMHILVAPIPYLWRRAQLVIWNRDRRKPGGAATR